MSENIYRTPTAWRSYLSVLLAAASGNEAEKPEYVALRLQVVLRFNVTCKVEQIKDIL